MSSKSSPTGKGKSAIPEQLQQLPHLAKESAEQIWLAGLGAFSKAQQEGGKVFNVLVQDGLALQKQAQAMAQEQFQAASSRFEDLTSKVSERAAEPLDKLESLFEQRVAMLTERVQHEPRRQIADQRRQPQMPNQQAQGKSERQPKSIHTARRSTLSSILAPRTATPSRPPWR